MKIFTGGGSAREKMNSALCKDCLEKVRAQFEKDDKGKINLGGEIPKLCEACKKKMKEQFNSSIRPDRKS